VRSQKQLDRVLDEIEEAPGIVLFTLAGAGSGRPAGSKCSRSTYPAFDHRRVMQLFQALSRSLYHGASCAAHLNAEYFKRIDALNIR